MPDAEPHDRWERFRTIRVSPEGWDKGEALVRA
jgi:hypothetical protein